MSTVQLFTNHANLLSKTVISLLSLFNILPSGTLSKNSVRGENNNDTVIILWAFLAAMMLAKDIIMDLPTAKNLYFYNDYNTQLQV